MLGNRYLIQGVIGVGGMGAVYRARDMHFQNVEKSVAVKEMVNQGRDPVIRDTIVRNFEREANILATLTHPSIPRIYDYFTHNERSYLILEFIDGKDLEALLEETKGFISEAQVIAWAIELCDVLHYLHTHKPEQIIFRDMKPSNIMINQHNHIVLIDFGIAKPFEMGPKGTMIGTEGYSPPEQYRGEATHLADIYALGATMHHLLTKRDPRLEAPFSFSERPIRELNPEVSLELETVINTAVHYNPENRFPSALEMKEALLTIAPQAAPTTKRATPNLVASRTGSTKLVWSFESEDEIRGTATYYNSTLLFGSYDNNLYALSAVTGEFVWKYPTDGGIVSKPVVQDDNIYIGSEDHRVHAVYARSGKVIWTYYTNGEVRSSPYYSDGHIFIGSDDGNLYAINALIGRKAWEINIGAPIRSTPLIFNDQIYFGAESGEFFCTDLSGKIKWRFKAKRAITSSAAIYQGMVFFGSMDSTLYALDAKTGWVIWRYRLGKPSISTPFIIDNYLFTGSSSGDIICIDIRTAKEVWHYSTDHQVTGSPIVFKDSVYCGSVDGHLYSLEYRTGRLRWKFRTEGPITGTPIAEAETIYIGSTDHMLYALAA
jgi:eukaryotic-like serine/threonine-protein kinase